VSLISRRIPRVPSLRHAHAHLSRVAAALLLLLGVVLSASACGMNVQTNNPYTPADGVNLDIGTVHVRNLMILSRTTGEGFLSASMVSADRDALVGVTGNPIKSDGADGAAFTATLPDPVALGNGTLIVLTNREFITLKSADLMPGLSAKLTLNFSQAGQVSIQVPIVDAQNPAYATITPTPSAAASS
jgi:hypothetical protein